jgi:hypothetical protein
MKRHCSGIDLSRFVMASYSADTFHRLCTRIDKKVSSFWGEKFVKRNLGLSSSTLLKIAIIIYVFDTQGSFRIKENCVVNLENEHKIMFYDSIHNKNGTMLR